jgi:cysteine synthase A
MPKTNNSILETIGNTPLVKLNRLTTGTTATVLVKLEARNPGGSLKDRIALNMINEAEKTDLIKPGISTIIEPTSGNTGIGLAMIAAGKGYHLILTMPETMSIDRRNLLKAYGAELVLTSGPDGMTGAVKKADELAPKLQLIRATNSSKTKPTPKFTVKPLARNLERYQRQSDIVVAV